MEILSNATIYKCSHCGHRYLTKSGCRLHEQEYCKDKNSPAYKKYLLKQQECNHENIETIWQPILGEEHRQEPAYEQCTDCGKIF